MMTAVALGVIALLALPAGLVVSAATLLNSTDGRNVTADSTIKIPSTPVALLAGVDSRDDIAMIAVFALSPSGRGGTIVSVPVGSNARIGRTGTIHRVDTAGTVEAFATLPPSVAAFHLAASPSGALYVTGPTLATRDAVYRIDPDGQVHVVSRDFGRPQGLAVGPDGGLFVVEALAGVSGVYRVHDDGTRECVVSGPDLVGVAFGPDGALAVVSSDTVYRFD